MTTQPTTASHADLRERIAERRAELQGALADVSDHAEWLLTATEAQLAAAKAELEQVKKERDELQGPARLGQMTLDLTREFAGDEIRNLSETDAFIKVWERQKEENHQLAERLRESEANCASMRKELQWFADWGRELNRILGYKATDDSWERIDAALAGTAGRALLAELADVRAKLAEAEAPSTSVGSLILANTGCSVTLGRSSFGSVAVLVCDKNGARPIIGIAHDGAFRVTGHPVAGIAMGQDGKIEMKELTDTQADLDRLAAEVERLKGELSERLTQHVRDTADKGSEIIRLRQQLAARARVGVDPEAVRPFVEYRRKTKPLEIGNREPDDPWLVWGYPTSPVARLTVGQADAIVSAYDAAVARAAQPATAGEQEGRQEQQTTTRHGDAGYGVRREDGPSPTPSVESHPSRRLDAEKWEGDDASARTTSKHEPAGNEGRSESKSEGANAPRGISFFRNKPALAFLREHNAFDGRLLRACLLELARHLADTRTEKDKRRDQLIDEVFGIPQPDPAMVKASREAYQRGDYKTAEQYIAERRKEKPSGPGDLAAEPGREYMAARAYRAESELHDLKASMRRDAHNHNAAFDNLHVELIDKVLSSQAWSEGGYTVVRARIEDWRNAATVWLSLMPRLRAALELRGAVTKETTSC